MDKAAIFGLFNKALSNRKEQAGERADEAESDASRDALQTDITDRAWTWTGVHHVRRGGWDHVRGDGLLQTQRQTARRSESKSYGDLFWNISFGLYDCQNSTSHPHAQVLQALGVAVPTEVKPAGESKTPAAVASAGTGSDETTPTGSDDGAEVGVHKRDPANVFI